MKTAARLIRRLHRMGRLLPGLATTVLVGAVQVAAAPLHAQGLQGPQGSQGSQGLDPARVPPRERAPTDLSQTRHLVLPNGMRAILVSDPKFNVSAVSVAVGVGSLADPPQRQGMAHYLEHMLFLGSEKYPSESEFDAYLQRNGGSNNAYTADDRTNYFLQIPHAAFEGALDRFAQFFIAPRFDPEFAAREVEAVNSEFQKNRENDGWRESALLAQVVRPGHPAAQFSIGSRATLQRTTREELLDFHRRHYGARRMTLAIAGQAGLDQLEHWARQYFGPVPDRAAPELRYAPDYLPRQPALRLLTMAPIQDQRHLTLSFALPDLRPDAGSKPAEQISFVLGHEGPGSLLARLKELGLASALSAGAQASTHDYGAFEIRIELTPQGLQQVPRVMSLVFSAIELLRREGVPVSVFGEEKTMAELGERWRDPGEGMERVVALSNLALDYPLAIAERVPALWLAPDGAALARVLGDLSPDNLLATLVAKGVPTDRVDPVFGTAFGYRVDPGDAYRALLNPPPEPALRLPAANPFMPDSTALQPLQPARLIDEPALSLYFAQDGEFQRPFVAHALRWVLPRERASLRDAAALRLYEACVGEATNSLRYEAGLAGLNSAIGAGLDGVTLAVEGYDSGAARLLDALVAALADCALPAERFAAVKDRVLRELSAFAHADAYQTLGESRRRVVREFHYRPDELLGALRELDQTALRAYARGLFARARLEMLSHGNLGPDAALAAARRVAAALGTQAPRELLRPRLLTMQPGQSLRFGEQLEVDNSAWRRELLLGDAGPEMRAAAAAIDAFVGAAFYSELRTRQQLGYIVHGGTASELDSTYALFLIQSGDHPADELARRADAYIAGLPEQLRALPADQWQAIVAGVRAKLQEKDKTIAERASRLFALAYERDADWARSAKTLAALERLSQQRCADILAAALAPATRRDREFLGFARQHPMPAGLITDLAGWKAGQHYER